ncbi:kinase-like protein [Hypoxylon sp. FL0890]|nr:kinase-like protein [Hypoxylon sp. FL0890]
MSNCNLENIQLSECASLTRETSIEYYDAPAWVSVEDVQLYNKGGFHPVHIGDILAGRFEVLHKLGHGGFSTVWLCLDTTNQRWRAVKIMTADHSSEARDIAVVDHLQREASLEQLEDYHISVPSEQFWVEGPNGRHLCFVTDVFGWNAARWSLSRDPTEEKTTAAINNVCHQIVEGLQFLHRKGICHGDLKPANVLMKLRSLDGLTKDQMLELTGEPDLMEIETVSGEDPRPHAPEYCVPGIPSGWCKSFVSDSVVIGDFGEAFHVSNPPKTTGIPELYAAPEILFEGVPGLASDIWSLACTLYEVKTHEFLFASLWGSSIRDLLMEIQHYIGPLPEPYKSVYRKQLFEHYGRAPVDVSNSNSESQAEQSTGTEGATTEPSTRDYDSPCPFEESLGQERQFHRDVPDSDHLPPEEQRETFRYRYTKEEISMLADLLKRMLRYNPSERIDIEEVFRHPWLQGIRDDKKSAGQSKSIWTLGLSLLSLDAFSKYCLPGYLHSKAFSQDHHQPYPDPGHV